jgi:amino acid adenylation domain-containing protein
MQSNHRCAHQLFEAQALRTPETIAVQSDGRSLTYRQLHEQSNRLARVLHKSGVCPAVRVGLFVERSTEMVVALLAILKAGGAYVPIDPSHGSGRMDHIISESGFSILITQKSLLRFVPTGSANIVLLDEWKESCVGESAQSFISEPGPSDLAYMIYTSGSTGKPKGVQIEHRSLVNFLCSMLLEPGFDASDTLLAVTTLAFDIAGLEIFLPLLAGGRVVVASRETASSGRLLKQCLEASEATVMQATPATWRLLFDSGWRGNPKLKVLVGGDALPAELARELASCCGEVWNMYGPTETTIWSSIYRVNGREERTVPIGQPIANTELHILDDDLRPVSNGREGELFIGGEGLARGYFDREQLTAERFLTDPFSSRPGARLYRTGDLVRCGPDGNVHFLGRTDHQVKVRGFRIEPGEIEAVLDLHPHVRHSVVVARENRLGEKYLVAYVVADLKGTVTPTPAQLRQHISGKLPEYMVPSAFVWLAALPLTLNGKVDRAALPAPDISDFPSDEQYVAPRDAVERKLVAIWEEILDVRPVGIKSTFLDLGGNSLLAVRLFMKILPVFGRDLPISTLLGAPTIEKLAKQLQSDAANEEAYPTVVALKPSGSKPPFFCVHGGLGGVLFLGALASHLDRDQPFYAIESEGLDGAPLRRPTVEKMASHYISEMRRIQPYGPYYLGGYCFGGVVAFEMAQQLLAQGEQVALVAQFSTPLQFNGIEKPVPQPAQGRVRRLFLQPISVIKTRLFVLIRISWGLQFAIRTRVATTAYRLLFTLGLRVPQRMRNMYVVRMLGRAEQDYAPVPYPGRLTLFYGRNPHHTVPNMGWSGLANSIENHIIGEAEVTSRRKIMVEPLVRKLAAELTICIDGAFDEHRNRLASQPGTGYAPTSEAELQVKG